MIEQPDNYEKAFWQKLYRAFFPEQPEAEREGFDATAALRTLTQLPKEVPLSKDSST